MFKDESDMIHFSKEEWEKKQYKEKWGIGSNVEERFRGKNRTLICDENGTCLITEGLHFVIDK